MTPAPDGRHTPMPKHLGPYYVDGKLVTLTSAPRGLPDGIILEVPIRGQPMYLGTLAHIEREAPYPKVADAPMWPNRKPGHRWA